ncbi:PAS domain S-box protein [Desulfosarcina sp.]|uniref:PAS domain-containing hybrid sensor histidine kinase/response regulator n=1 Tax=Desulfosarcina sp. TaxID=2027861 RepID=UPI00397054AB
MSAKPTYEEMEQRVRGDITDLKRTEGELAQIFAMSLDMICIADINTATFIKVNPAFTEILGYVEEELLSRPFFDFIHPDDIDVTRTVINQTLHKGAKVIYFENRYRCKDGSYKWLSWVSHPNLEKGDTYSVARDVTERKQAERKLLESERIMQQIIKHDPNAIAVYDRNLRYIAVSDRYLQDYNVADKNIVGKHHYEVFPEMPQRWKDIHQRVLEGATERNDDDHFKRPDGSTTYNRWECRPWYTANGSIGGMITYTEVTTERKLAEKELIQSRSHLRTLVNSIPDLVWLKDQEGIYLSCNPVFERFFGAKESEIIGKTDYDFVDKDLADSFRTYDRVAMKARRPSKNEEELTFAASGFSGLFETIKTPMHDSDGSIIGVLGIARDITERKKSESELINQKRLFETMFNTIPDGVVITNTQREIQLANKGMGSTFGYKPEALLGKSTQILYASQSGYIETGTSVFENKSINPENLYVTRYRDKSGREFSGETFGAKLFDESGQWIGNLGIMRDITEREQAAMRIQQAQKIESIGSLAGGIAHDFNNLLFPIVGLAELLMEDLAPDSQEHENAEEIYNAGKRGSDLVKQILAFSRQSEHKKIPVRVQQVLKEVLKLCRATIPANIEITRNISSDCGMVMADPTQIHQIAMNLITNAYHAVEPTGGKISVQLRAIEIDRDESAHSLLRPGQYVMLSVSDTGCGIDPKIVDKIFDPYFTTKGQGKGTGLGLSVVHGIVKQYNGDIKVYSEAGIGTTINVYLPLMEKSPEAVSLEKVSSIFAGDERILLVDDEEPIMRLEKQILERLGYQVTSRISSVDALEAFKANPDAYDLVITDMTMPNMTGDQFARKLLSIRPDMPVIILTGFSERISQENAADFGIKGLLMKPIVKSELAKMIRQVLDEAKGKTQP